LKTAPNTPRPEFLTIYEAADVLKMHFNTVRRHCESGALAAEKLGSKWLIPVSTLYKLGAGK
jgi:excisionase family DNA binding protein